MRLPAQHPHQRISSACFQSQCGGKPSSTPTHHLCTNGISRANTQAGKYAEARAAYSASIAAQPSHLALANRAMAALKLRDFAAAEADCTAAIEVDAAYVKASRRVTLHVQPGSLEAEMAPYCQDGSPYPCFWRPTAQEEAVSGLVVRDDTISAV